MASKAPPAPGGGAGLLRTGKDRADCVRQFKAAWERFAADPINLTMFLVDKRRARRGG
jgi:hypothetical protein